MKLLDRYIILSVLTGVAMSMMVIATLIVIFTFADEFNNINVSYGLINVLQFVILTLPRRIYEMFPVIVLIGGLFGLGQLASHNELTVMRASGFSVRRISRAVLVAGLVLSIAVAIVGEFVAPQLEQQAHLIRSAKQQGQITVKGRFGFWDKDGDVIINIREVYDKSVKGVYIYQMGTGRRIAHILRAKSAKYADKQWHFQDVQQTLVLAESVVVTNSAHLILPKFVSPDRLANLAVKPEYQSISGLKSNIEHLQERNLDYRHYELAYWSKLLAPFATLVMLLIAIPFVFNTVRSTNTGQRLFFGIIVGIVFFLVNKYINQLGLAYGLPAYLSVGLPILIFAVLSASAMRRVE